MQYTTFPLHTEFLTMFLQNASLLEAQRKKIYAQSREKIKVRERERRRIQMHNVYTSHHRDAENVERDKNVVR